MLHMNEKLNEFNERYEGMRGTNDISEWDDEVRWMNEMKE